MFLPYLYVPREDGKPGGLSGGVGRAAGRVGEPAALPSAGLPILAHLGVDA